MRITEIKEKLEELKLRGKQVSLIAEYQLLLKNCIQQLDDLQQQNEAFALKEEQISDDLNLRESFVNAEIISKEDQAEEPEAIPEESPKEIMAEEPEAIPEESPKEIMAEELEAIPEIISKEDQAEEPEAIPEIISKEDQAEEPEAIPEVAKKEVVVLEQNSTHPIEKVKLRRAVAGLAYYEKINLDLKEDKSLYQVEVEGANFLEFDLVNFAFKGIPLSPGDFHGRLLFFSSKENQELELIEKELEFEIGINANPQSLWKNLPPPEDGRFFKKNEDSIKGSYANMKYVAASIRGVSHAHIGSFRDDDFTQMELGDWFLQVVADGAGSAKYSREGSRKACDFMKANMSKLFETKPQLFSELSQQIQAHYLGENSHANSMSTLVYKIMAGTAYQTYKDLTSYALQEELIERDLYTTLLFTLSRVDKSGSCILSFSIGDGAIGYVQKDAAHLISNPDSGQYAGQTLFVNSPNIFADQQLINRCGIRILPAGFDALLLMTDGVSDPLFGPDTHLRDPEKWQSFWAGIKENIDGSEDIEHSLENWLNFYQKGEYDDRTISILYS